MKKILFKTLIPFLLLGGANVNNAYGMEQCSHHPHESIHTHKMVMPQYEVILIPFDVSKLFFNYLQENYPLEDKTITSFAETCRAWKAIVDNYDKVYYEAKNKEEHIFSWKECANLPARILNRLNADYRFMLGMHRNVILQDVEESDRARFEITCEHIVNTPNLPDQSLIKLFSELLRLHLHIEKPTVYQIDLDAVFRSKDKLRESFGDKLVEVNIQLSNIINQKNIKFQNEIVLYFYYTSILKKNHSLDKIRNNPFFEKLTCNIFDVLKNNDRLIVLKKIDNKTDKVWKEIINLDCAPTSYYYNEAAVVYYSAGKQKEALDYIKKAIKTEQQGRADKPNLVFLHNIALYYKYFSDFEKMAYYYDQYFSHYVQKKKTNKLSHDEIHIHTHHVITNLRNAAEAHKYLGNKDKEAYYRNIIEEKEKAEVLRLVQVEEKEKAEALRQVEEKEKADALRQVEEKKKADALHQVEPIEEKNIFGIKFSKKSNKRKK